MDSNQFQNGTSLWNKEHESPFEAKYNKQNKKIPLHCCLIDGFYKAH